MTQRQLEKLKGALTRGLRFVAVLPNTEDRGFLSLVDVGLDGTLADKSAPPMEAPLRDPGFVTR